LPKIILFDAANRIHRPNVGSDAEQFDSYLGSPLNDLIFIVSPLPWVSIGIKFYVFGNELLVVRYISMTVDAALTSRETKSCRGPAIARKPS